MKIENTVPRSALLLAFIIGATASQAASVATNYNMIITTAEGAGAFNSTLSGTSVQTFDNLLGINNNVVWEGVGTFDKLNVIAANAYGGAPSAAMPKGTPYAVEGLGKVTTTTLRLNQSSSYFGLYWSAGDSANNLKFYDQGVLVADFTTANLMNLLPTSYNGNPITQGNNVGVNKSERYGFINFMGDDNTSWDTIVFGNNGSSGFEADNYTTRTTGWNPTEDGALPGAPALFVQNSKGIQTISQITQVTTAGDQMALSLRNAKTGASTVLGFAPAAPAAPAPPMVAVVAFVAAIALKGFRPKKVAA
ncbi:hypothetical protein HQ447_13545 [bacterium]|nr:hypothetical protein [bacterium]